MLSEYIPIPGPLKLPRPLGLKPPVSPNSSALPTLGLSMLLSPAMVSGTTVVLPPALPGPMVIPSTMLPRSLCTRPLILQLMLPPILLPFLPRPIPFPPSTPPTQFPLPTEHPPPKPTSTNYPSPQGYGWVWSIQAEYSLQPVRPTLIQQPARFNASFIAFSRALALGGCETVSASLGFLAEKV